ncbi:hypothetical protein C5961_16800 [Cronobacter sakazakii]|nr:hypothetical protein C5961_16800 [Cronobacter sakazakii]
MVHEKSPGDETGLFRDRAMSIASDRAECIWQLRQRLSVIVPERQIFLYLKGKESFLKKN